MSSRHADSLFIDAANMVLATDLYQLTMMAAYLESEMEEPATFELFVRRLPRDRYFLLAAGLEQCVQYLTQLRFDGDSIDFLRDHEVFQGVSPRFFERLRAWRFTGELRAMAEGTPVYGNEAILQVTAPLFEAQLVETYLLSVINHQTMIASKAARVALACQGRRCVDFGTRRAHGPSAAVYAARAAYIGGMHGTSNLLAGKLCHIPVVGTAAHAFTMACPSEEAAFARYHKAFPEHTTLLIDTYDTPRGAERACDIEGTLRGVRLDSGDLLEQSRAVREILDRRDRSDARIVASGDLNEIKIRDLLAAGAPIDIFGVGTDLVTSRDQPALGGVYKLVARTEGGVVKPAIKLAEGKITYPGRKQFWRVRGADGTHRYDVMQLAETAAPAVGAGETVEPLLETVLADGCLVMELPSCEAIRARAVDNLARLPAALRAIEQTGARGAGYEVRIGEDVAALVTQLSAQHGRAAQDTGER